MNKWKSNTKSIKLPNTKELPIEYLLFSKQCYLHLFAIYQMIKYLRFLQYRFSASYMVGIFFYSYIMILTTSPRIQIRFGDIDIIWHLSKILRFKIQLWTRFIILQILMSQFYVLLFWLLKLYNISSSDFIVHWVSC